MEQKKIDFEILVNKHTASMYAWAFSKTSHKEISVDLVQEAFIAAYEKYENFSNNSSVKTWLFSILSNKICDYYRRSFSKFDIRPIYISEEEGAEITDSFFDSNENWTQSPKKILGEDESKNLLDDPDFLVVFDLCMEDLPPKWKFAIMGKYILERKTEEICQELNITTTNYWQMLHRAKLLLRKCIENNWK